MPDFLIYVLQVNVAVMLFFLLYRLFFRSLTFYSINRFILLLGLTFALVYPFLDFSMLFSQTANFNAPEAFTLDTRSTPLIPQHAAQANSWLVLQWLLLGVGMLMLIRLLLRLLALYHLHTQTKPAHFQQYHYRKTAAAINPFSFLKNIYINPDCHHTAELQTILKHEQVHVDEKHTLDLLLAESMLLICWFNPAMWFIKKAISENLEFITDQQLLSGGLDSKTYQYSLLKISSLNTSTQLGPNFNFLTIKTRISMMNKKRSSKLQLLRYSLILPMVTVLAWACSEMPEPQEAAPALQSTEQAAISATDATYYLDGKEVPAAETEDLDPKEIASIQVVKGDGAINSFGEEGKQGIIAITTKANAESPEVIALQEKIALSPDFTPEEKAKKPATKVSVKSENSLQDKYILIDGEEVDYAAFQSLQKENIKNVEVWKGKQAIEKYGNKAANGAIIITTK